MSHGESVSELVVRLLSEARQEQGYTMEEVADRAEIHRTYVGLLERGERQPTVDVAVRIAEALGLRLSSLIQRAEDAASGADATAVEAVEIVTSPERRTVARTLFREAGGKALSALTGLDTEAIAEGIESAYHTMDLIDAQLLEKGSPRLSQLVELANLSSMLGNLLGAGVAQSSGGGYARNRPHTYPDLLSQRATVPHLEVKTALETNKPKGHLPKAGAYLTFRYVLTNSDGPFVRGKETRGKIATIWEVKAGMLTEADFDISNTEGDSGKTAVIKTTAFAAMNLIYYDPQRDPYARPRYPEQARKLPI